MGKDVTVQQIADHLQVNKWTIYRWIEWYYSDLKKPQGTYLPPFRLKGVYKIYKEEDIKVFEEFRKNLPFGAMREYNNHRFKNKKDPMVAEAIKNSRENQRKAALNYKK